MTNDLVNYDVLEQLANMNDCIATTRVIPDMIHGVKLMIQGYVEMAKLDGHNKETVELFGESLELALANYALIRMLMPSLYADIKARDLRISDLETEIAILKGESLSADDIMASVKNAS